MTKTAGNEMTERDFNRLVARCEVLVRRWAKEIGFGWWRLTVKYVRDPSHFGQREGNWVCMMQTSVRWHYREVVIEVNAQKCYDETDESLERYFVHELVHALVNEMRVPLDRESAVQRVLADEQLTHEEHVCSQIASALIWARQAGYRDAKKNDPLLPLIKERRRR